MTRPRPLTIASAIGFVAATVSLLFFWPSPEEYREVGTDVRGCFAADGFGHVAVGPNNFSVISNGPKISGAAKEGSDKIGRYILTDPGIEWERSGVLYRPLIGNPRKSVWIEDRNTLSTYARDGVSVKFLRQECREFGTL